MFYTTQELSQLLRLTPTTLRRMAELGNLPHPLIIGTTYRWPKQAIDKFLKQIA